MAADATVRLTIAAQDDLREIAIYRAQVRGWDEADALIARLQAHTRALAPFPLRGPVPKELRETGRTDIRQTVLGPTRIFYRVAQNDIAVFMIVDGRRDIDTLLGIRLNTPDLFDE